MKLIDKFKLWAAVTYESTPKLNAKPSKSREGYFFAVGCFIAAIIMFFMKLWVVGILALLTSVFCMYGWIAEQEHIKQKEQEQKDETKL